MRIKRISGLLLSSLALSLPCMAQTHALRLPTGSEVVFPHHSIMNTTVPATMEAWIAAETSGTHFVPFVRYASSAEHKSIEVWPDARVKWLYAGRPWAHTGSCVETSPGAFPIDGEFHHLAFVRRNNGSWETFLDGVSIATGGPGGCCWLTCDTINANTTSRVLGGDGWLIRGMRVSNGERYSGTFTPEDSWTPDGTTVMQVDFEEGAGNQVGDVGPANQIGTINGDYEWVEVGTPEPENRGVYLDGDGDGVYVPPHVSLDEWDEYTMELWVDREAGSNRLIRAGDPYQQSIELTGDAADVYMHHNWSHNNQEGTDCGGNQLGDSEWTHIAATFSDQVIRLYQNGELMYECGGMETPFEGMGYPLRIGHAFFFWNDNYLQGRIDEVRLWSYARSEQELRSTINKQIGASEAANYPGLVSSWGFEGDTQDATGLNQAELVGDAHFVDSTDIPVLFDCDQNGISDAEDIAADPGADCNLNGTLDVCEAIADSGVDCDGDGVLDVCQGAPDCNGNGVPDLCDIFNGSSADCNQNGIPDECELEGNDCNQNGWLDECDDLCFGQPCPDCDGDGIPDECEIADGTQNDCNQNGVPDSCECMGGTISDCNSNCIPDECEFFDGTLTDLNNNGVADQCECPVFSYCMTSPNSVGEGVVLSSEGSACPDLNNLTLVAEGGPTGQPGLMFYGATTANQPFGMGVRCVGGPIYRLNTVFFGGAGRSELELDLARGPMGFGPGAITAGSTWYFQLWYRDPASGSWGFNLSNGLAATFGS